MTQKTVYQTDRAGQYVGTTVADEFDLEPGVYQMPAGAVETPPPEKWPDDKWPRWIGKRWELIQRPVPVPAIDNESMAKLAAFLAANPDVAQMISSKGGV